MFTVPPYCEFSFSPRSLGFFLDQGAPEDIAHDRNLRDPNPWVVLSCALARAQQGYFDAFPVVADWMKRFDDLIFFLDAGALFAHAAPLSALDLFRQAYPTEMLEQHPECVRQYCQVLCRTLTPRYLDEVLHWHRKTPMGWVYIEVAWELSYVWEDEPGPIHEGPQMVRDPQYPPPFEQKMRDYDGYHALVREHVARTPPAAFILGGAPFSVVGLAKRMLAHAKAGEDSSRTNFERMLFEANTGISCREFFTNDEEVQFRPLAASAILEDFLADPWRDHFEDGVRYFFGHRVPD